MHELRSARVVTPQVYGTSNSFIYFTVLRSARGTRVAIQVLREFTSFLKLLASEHSTCIYNVVYISKKWSWYLQGASIILFLLHSVLGQ